MWNVVQFPQAHVRDRSSSVRVAYVADRWCFEHVKTGDITGRRPMPSLADAQRIATRISRRDRVPLLAPCVPHPSRRADIYPTPDDAA